MSTSKGTNVSFINQTFRSGAVSRSCTTGRHLPHIIVSAHPYCFYVRPSVYGFQIKQVRCIYTNYTDIIKLTEKGSAGQVVPIFSLILGGTLRIVLDVSRIIHDLTFCTIFHKNSFWEQRYNLQCP